MDEARCKIDVSEDKLKVYLSLCLGAEQQHGCKLAVGAIAEQLTQQGIVYGLDSEAIRNGVQHFKQHPESNKRIIIAKGSVDTSDDPLKSLELFFKEVPATYQKCHKDGAVTETDYIQVAFFRKGDKLAALQPEGELEPGHDVFGNRVQPQVKKTGVKIIAGEHVFYEQGSNAFIATESGYPAVTQSRENDIAIYALTIQPVLQVAPDAMAVTLLLRPPPPSASCPDMEVLLSVLDERGIVAGKLTRQIQTCIETVSGDQVPADAIVALGLPARDGEDARLDFAIEVGPLPGKIRGDGSIDFRERKKFVAVDKDQVVAVKIPFTLGKPGVNVLGETLPAKPGKDLVIKATDDAIFDHASGEIRATRSGVLSMVSDTSVKVCAKQVVSGDVDFETGNIISRDALEVTGSIRPLFKIVAFGDIAVGGNVEKANIRSAGNIVIKGGIIGERARVEAKGDVDFLFLEHGRVFSEGNVILRKSCYYCRLHARGSIICPAGSKIIASQVVAADVLILGDVGSNNADPVLIAANVDPERLQLYYEYRRARDEKKRNLDTLVKRRGSGQNGGAFTLAEQELSWAEDALQTLNMLPGTKLGDHPQTLTQLPKADIQVHGTICKGTTLRIGNAITVLDEEMSKVRFFVTYKLGKGTSEQFRQEIICTPLGTKK